MKRARFLLLALVVAIMMMGAGYAYWSERIEIKNTVNTGELDVKFTEADVKVDDDYEDLLDKKEEKHRSKGAPWVAKAEVDSKDNKKVVVEVKNMYPGARFTVETKLKNTGTIHAKLTDIEFDFEHGSKDFAKYLILKEIKIGDKTYESDKAVNKVDLSDWEVKLLKTSGLRTNEAENVEGVQPEWGWPWPPKPDPEPQPDPDEDTIDIEYTFEIDRKATENQVKENATYKFSLKAIVRQLNDRGDGRIRFDE